MGLKVHLSTRDQVEVRLVVDPAVLSAASAEQVARHMAGEASGIEWPDDVLTVTIRPLGHDELARVDDEVGPVDRLGALADGKVQDAVAGAAAGEAEGFVERAARAERAAVAALDDEERAARLDFQRRQRRHAGALVDASLLKLSGIEVTLPDGTTVDSGALKREQIAEVLCGLGRHQARAIIDEIAAHVRRVSELPALGKAFSPPRSG
jgi:hypothetical protein